tara:strand:- start:291 stop:1577 length:1287 start_codon:yes stop_codon:yes gene_type:complete
MEEYNEKEREFIIKNGIIVLENSKQFFGNNKIDYMDTLNRYETKEKDKIINNLKEEIDRIEKEKRGMYEDMNKSVKEEKSYFINQINSLQEEKKSILNRWDENLKERTEMETTKYKTQLEEAKSKVEEVEKKNKYYYNLYESNEKGMNLENELYPKLLEYNDKYMNSMWEITHVGQVLSQKGDFHFKHKHTNKIIIMDTKNNITNNPVNNIAIDKFENDILSKKTNSIGGILLAKEKICKRKNFEIIKIVDKYAFYVSHFNITNVAYIFTLLDQLLELNDNKNDSDMIENKLKSIYIENYKTEKLKLDKLERDKKEITFKINNILHDFKEIFDEDIDFILNNKGIKESLSQEKNNSTDTIIDYESLEENKKLMNRISEDKKYRTKYYLCFKNADGEDCIQYFKNNYALNQKKNKINSCSTENTTIVFN